MSTEILLDVSELEPPQPLELAVAALRTLAADQHLRLRHRREPCLLYPILDRSGFQHRLEPLEDGLLDVVIWRDEPART